MREQEIVALDYHGEELRRGRENDAAYAQNTHCDFPADQHEHGHEERPGDASDTPADLIPHGLPRWRCADAGHGG